jgi:hypothetical protein
MRMSPTKLVVAFACGAAAAIVLGLAVGHGDFLGKSLLVGLGIGGMVGGFLAVTLVPLFVVLFAFLFVRRERRGVRLAFSATAAALFVSSCVVAEKDSQTAFNDCVKRGELVRAHLRAFHSRNGRYPGELAELGVRDLPCSSQLSGSILRYERRGNGYYLAFEDFLVIHEATEQSEFFATHK